MKKQIVALMASGIILSACNSQQGVTPYNGWNDKNNDTTKTQETASNSTGLNADGSFDIAMTNEKLNYYVLCLNDHSQEILNSFDRYASWIDLKNGPTGKEGYVYGLYKIYKDNKDCVNGIKLAKAMKPDLPEIDKKAEAYGAALEAVTPLIKEAYDYYDLKNYLDDNFKRGKELHPALVKAWTDFEKANDDLKKDLSDLKDKLDEQELKRLEETEGKLIPYMTLNLMVIAKQTIHLAEGNDILKIDLAKLNNKIDEFQLQLDDLTKYYEDNKKTMEFVSLDSYISDCKEFYIAAKDLMRRVRDKKPYTKDELQQLSQKSSWVVEGSYGAMIEKYNALVQSSNYIYY